METSTTAGENLLNSPFGTWDGLIVICATTRWDGNRLLDQHMAMELAKYAPVLYVDPAVSRVGARRNPAAAAALAEPRLRLVSPRIARLSVVAPPGHQRRLIKPLSLGVSRRRIRRAVAALGSSRVHAVIVPSLNPMFGLFGERFRVFYAKDDYVAGAALMGVSAASLRRAQLAQPHAANLIVAASPMLAEMFKAAGHESLLLPNGCDDTTLARTDEAPLPDDVTLPAPIVGFIGHLSHRIDISLLEAIAARGHSLLLVGPLQGTFDIERMTGLLQRPNVQWVGAKTYGELPSYLKLIEVGLVPYTNSEFNRASFPLKLLEYVAAGRRVVSTDLPAARWLQTEHVVIASGAEAYADAVTATLAKGRTSDAIRLMQEFASTHSWQHRGRALAAALALCPDNED